MFSFIICFLCFRKVFQPPGDAGQAKKRPLVILNTVGGENVQFAKRQDYLLSRGQDTQENLTLDMLQQILLLNTKEDTVSTAKQNTSRRDDNQQEQTGRGASAKSRSGGESESSSHLSFGILPNFVSVSLPEEIAGGRFDRDLRSTGIALRVERPITATSATAELCCSRTDVCYCCCC